MEGYYASFKCKSCKREMILVTDDVSSAKLENKFIACCFCGSKHLVKEKVTDDLKECMNERSYFRGRNGAIKQR